MATQTTKRGLRKPELSDYVNVVTDINNNMDNLDNAVPDTRTVNGHALTSNVTVTKGDVGLGNVDNTSDANKPVSTAQQTALDGKVPVTREINGHPLSANVTVTKSDVGLGNVDNTSDANKPISDAVAAKLGTVPSGKTLQGEIDATNSDVSDLKLAILLQEETIPDTTQTIAFDSSGNVSSIVHKDGSNNTIRSDAFTFGTNTITEVRTLYTGETLTIVTNTDTLVTTVTYSAA